MFSHPLSTALLLFFSFFFFMFVFQAKARYISLVSLSRSPRCTLLERERESFPLALFVHEVLSIDNTILQLAASLL